MNRDCVFVVGWDVSVCGKGSTFCGTWKRERERDQRVRDTCSNKDAIQLTERIINCGERKSCRRKNRMYAIADDVTRSR